jgi:tRNA threonylcarbamoyladenosine biosynthesis protein TsaE
MVVIVTRSEAETVSLGESVGRHLQPGDFIALYGNLGSGKTRFAKGIALGIGIDPAVPVTSPTYTILNEYPGKLPLFHFDLYRLAGDEDTTALGFEEYFYGEGVCLVEWADRLVAELPPEHLRIEFAEAGEEERRIGFTPHGARYEALVEDLERLERQRER